MFANRRLTVGTHVPRSTHMHIIITHSRQMRLFASVHASKPVFPVHKRNAFAKLTHETRFLHTRNVFTLTAKRVCYKRETRHAKCVFCKRKMRLIYTLRLTGTVVAFVYHLLPSILSCFGGLVVSLVICR